MSKKRKTSNCPPLASIDKPNAEPKEALRNHAFLEKIYSEFFSEIRGYRESEFKILINVSVLLLGTFSVVLALLGRDAEAVSEWQRKIAEIHLSGLAMREVCRALA